MADEADDIENEEEGAEGGEAKKKPGIMKLALFIGLPVLILLLGGVAAFMMLGGGGDDEHVVAEGEHHEEGGDGHGASHDEPEHVYIYDMLDDEGEPVQIIVNIRSMDGDPILLQMTLKFESTDPELEPLLHERLPQIMDGFVAFLSALREDDFYGSAGPQRVRLELLRRINLAIEPAHIDRVLVVEMLIAG